MTIKVVFHIDSNDEGRIIMAINNVKNLLKEISPDKASICLLINGAAVELLKRPMSRAYADQISLLSNKAVRFLACNNSLINMKTDKNELHESCEVVKAGIIELVRLQNDGYAYIKP